MTTAQKIWAFVKPIIIVVLGAIGYFSSGEFVPRNLFLLIIALSFLFRGASIIGGFVSIYKYFTNKDE